MLCEFNNWCNKSYGGRFLIDPEFRYDEKNRAIYYINNSGQTVVLESLPIETEVALIDIDGLLDYHANGGSGAQFYLIGPTEEIKMAKDKSDQIVQLQNEILDMIEGQN